MNEPSFLVYRQSSALCMYSRELLNVLAFPNWKIEITHVSKIKIKRENLLIKWLLKCLIDILIENMCVYNFLDEISIKNSVLNTNLMMMHKSAIKMLLHKNSKSLH